LFINGSKARPVLDFSGLAWNRIDALRMVTSAFGYAEFAKRVSTIGKRNSLIHLSSLNAGNIGSLPYSSWLLKFCVSVSWRVLTLLIEEADLNHFPEELKTAAERAHTTWKGFLLDTFPIQASTNSMISDCLARGRSKTSPELNQVLQSHIAGYSAAGSVGIEQRKKEDKSNRHSS
jgi:hypothetical protein